VRLFVLEKILIVEKTHDKKKEVNKTIWARKMFQNETV